MVDYYLDITVAGEYVPSIGDINGTTNPQAKLWNAGIFRRAFDVYRDPRHARALIQLGTAPKELYPDASDEELQRIEADAADLGLETRSLGGYGLAVLESGEGDNRRAAAMYYGSQGAWHGHKDRLNIEYIARDRTYMMEMGYPAHWGDKAYEWTMGTASHYVVLVNEEGHHGKPAGKLHALADSPMVKLMDASAERVYPGTASLYRRAVAMIDVGPRDSYLVDIFRVRGGSQHDYSFHGLPDGEMSLDGVALDDPHPGTVAGDDLPFGGQPEDYQGSGYQYLFNARYGKPEGAWRAAWEQADGNGMRLWMLDGACQELVVADCEPELKPNAPKEIKYLLARNRGENLNSAFAGVIEPYLRRPLLDSVERLWVTKCDAPADVVALRVKLGRRTDEIVSSLSERPCELESGLRANAEFAAVSFDHAGLLFAVLVNGRSLSHQGVEITCGGPIDRRIAAIDYDRNEIALDGPLPAHAALVNSVVIIGDANRSTNYTVRSVRRESGWAMLGFGDVSPVIGIGVVGEIRARQGTVATPTSLWGYGGKFKALSMPGMALLNEAKTEAFPITAHEGGTFTVGNRRPLGAAMADADGDGRAMFHVCDLKVGDVVRIPAVVSITRTRVGEYEVRSTLPASVALPNAAARIRR
ncbi:MAG: heparinase II/III family protein [Armatimonadota bacterium]|nr:MAG: heparinase II/III family protein [Armatimonadota bacterium]